MSIIILIAALIVAYLMGLHTGKKKLIECVKFIDDQEKVIRDLQVDKILLQVQKKLLVDEKAEAERLKQKLEYSRLIITPAIHKLLQEINEETYQAYELYKDLSTTLRYVFKNQDPEENKKIVNMIRQSILLHGPEEVKRVFIGTMFKEMLYKSDEEMETDVVSISRQEYLLTDGCMLEKYIDKIAAEVRDMDNCS